MGSQNGYTVHALTTAHDWEDEQLRNKDFWDDGTNTFFWRAHRLSVLALFTLSLFYIALFEKSFFDSEYNTKRGVVACILVFVLFGVTHTPDGPFKRPHPAFWRLVLCLSIVYELALVYLLFQTVDDARQLMRHLDPSLGRPLPEKDYGETCDFYDSSHSDPFHNVWDKMDAFVLVHLFGWWLKTLILRDYWLCMVLSVMFELLEYTFEHQLPNFSECWWDHGREDLHWFWLQWILDTAICNQLGIYLGMKTVNYLSMKPYHWRGMWNIPSYRGKLSRILRQFTPYYWTDFDWKPTSSLKRWLAMLGLIAMFLLGELNAFLLKFVLWIPPPHFLCLSRLVFFLLMGAVAMREMFQYLDDPNCVKFGTQSWIVAAVVITELLITLKFDRDTLTKPIPRHMTLVWLCMLVCVSAWTLWHFYLQRLLCHTEYKIASPPRCHGNRTTNGKRAGRMCMKSHQH